MNVSDQYDVIWLSDWIQHAYPFLAHNQPLSKRALVFYVMSRHKITDEQKNTISLSLADKSFSPSIFLHIDSPPNRDFFELSGQLPYHYLLIFDGVCREEQELIQPDTQLILAFDRHGTKASLQWKLDKKKCCYLTLPTLIKRI